MKSIYIILFILFLVFLICSCEGKKTGQGQQNVQKEEVKKVDISFTRNDHDFKMIFPGDWKGYMDAIRTKQVREDIVESIIYIGLPTDHDWPALDFPVGYASMFLIAIYNFDDSEGFQDFVESENVQIGTKIYQDSYIYFGYTIMQDCPDDLYEKQRQISRIIKTFSYWGDSEINAPNYVEPYHGDPYSYYDYEYWEEDMELPYSYDTFYYPGYDEEY